MLILQRTRVWLPTPKWRLTTVGDSCSRGFDNFFWHPQAPDMHMMHIHTCRQNNCTFNFFLIFKNTDKEYPSVCQCPRMALKWIMLPMAMKNIFVLFYLLCLLLALENMSITTLIIKIWQTQFKNWSISD